MAEQPQAYEFDARRIGRLVSSYRRGGPLQRAFYTARDVFNADLERIWRRYWLYAGHSCMLPQPGSWMTWSVGDDQVVIVRDRAGVIRAFHNVCRHRGSRLCADETGNSRLLVCPYHAWTYDLDGSLRTRTEHDFGVPSGELGLIPVDIKELGGVLFVALGDDPEPFEEAARELGAELPHQGFVDAKVATSIRYTVNANWKLVFENNRECYHCANVHPEYVRGTYDIARFDPAMASEVEEQTALANARFRRLGLGGAVATSAMTGRYWRVSRAPLMAGFMTETLDGRPAAPLMGRFRELGEWSMGTLRATVFPNFWQHANDDHAVATRLTPIDPATTQVDVHWLVHKDAVEGQDYQLCELMPFWQRTSEQDWAICAANQLGVSSPAYRPGPYATVKEANVQQFVDWYLEALAGRSSASDPIRPN